MEPTGLITSWPPAYLVIFYRLCDRHANETHKGQVHARACLIVLRVDIVILVLKAVTHGSTLSADDCVSQR